MTKKQSSGVSPRLEVKDLVTGRVVYATEDPECAAHSFIWHNRDPEPRSLLINGVEFEIKARRWWNLSGQGYPQFLVPSVQEDIEYCIDLYLAFYADQP